MKKLVLVCLCSLLFMSCKKENHEFTLKSIKLNSYDKSHYPSQNLSLKVVRAETPDIIIANTESYPSALTLPATFSVKPRPVLRLYKENIVIQLWGESSGLIASSKVNMKEYKIIYPIDMETENEEVSFSIMGSWE